MPPKKKSINETPPVPGVEAFNAEPIIDKYYPNKFDMKRKIAYLFDKGDFNFYRVNFHNAEKSNTITESYFVSINRNTCALKEHK